MKLNIKNRVKLLDILNSYKGTLDGLAVVLDDLKEIRFSDEENKDFEIKIEGNAVNWNPKKEKEKEVTVSKITTDWVNKFIGDKDSKSEITVDDIELIDLRTKLNEKTK